MFWKLRIISYSLCVFLCFWIIGDRSTKRDLRKGGTKCDHIKGRKARDGMEKDRADADTDMARGSSLQQNPPDRTNQAI